MMIDPTGHAREPPDGQRKGPTSAKRAAPPELQSPFFRLRLINIDHVLLRPGPLDRIDCPFNAAGVPLSKVPVLRIFGATPAGQRVCLHMHNVFPYCYIQYKESLEPDYVLRYIYRLGRELNLAMAASLRRNPTDPDSSQFIAAIHLCKGVPFYGYHVGWSYFLKISFIDPSHSYRIAAILETGGVMRTRFQPFEIHIRYQLQFMLDYNIFGCDFIDLDDARFRAPVPLGDDVASDESISSSFSGKIWNQNTIPTRTIQGPEARRNSHCALELDASAPWIINRRKLQARNLHHDFDEKQPEEDEVSEKLVPSMRGLWEDERLRRIAKGISGSIPTPGTQGGSRKYGIGESPEWNSEERMRLLLAKRLAEEKTRTVERERRPQNFTKAHSLDDYIMTAFEAVEVFHPYVEDKATDPYTQRSGPSCSAKIFDLHHSMTQTSIPGSAEDTDDKRAGAVGNGVEGEDEKVEIDTSLFQSQEFRAKLESAEEDDCDSVSEMSNDEEEDNLVEGGEGMTSASNSPRRGQSTVPSFVRSPTASPNKRKENPEGHDAIRSGSPKKVKVVRGVDIEEAQGLRAEELSERVKEWSGDSLKSSEKRSPTPGLKTRTSRVRFASDSAVLSTPPNAKYTPSLTSAESSPSGIVGEDTSEYVGVCSPLRQSRQRFVFAQPAPSAISVTRSFGVFSLVNQVHQDPFFSDPTDIPEHAREYAGRLFKFESDKVKFLKHFQHWEGGTGPEKMESTNTKLKCWEFGPPPPTRLEVESWSRFEAESNKEISRRRRQRFVSQIERPTPSDSYGFKISQHKSTSLVEREKQHMTILAIEVHVLTRGRLMPDPKEDGIEAIIYSFQNEDERLQGTGSRPELRTGIILVAQENMRHERLGINNLAVEEVESELELFNALVDLVRAFDPEILAGYEIHSSSWGYAVERASRAFDYDLVPELGRVISQNTGRAGGKSDNSGWTQSSALRITGRHVLNIWRLMKSELTLNLYSFENVCFHLLHKRVPKFSHATLTSWYRSGIPELVARTLRYLVERVELVLDMIQESDLVLRTAEFARIYGIDFFSVISRGSQFKVESIMLRIAKPESFILISPNRSQVGKQNAAECLPLIMEPQSAFYKGPLLVLDFQSLYPSIMIAYNICYSTCLGRVSSFKGASKFGVSELELPKGLLSVLKDHVNISANGLLFVKPSLRRSLLAKMLSEILDTRVMVKASTKGMKHDKAFLKVQNARQLSLKLLANVTYGYTSASYSGRMPCVEIADAIVQQGRETLEKAMDLINGSQKWGAQVVYGDTDSLFIYLPGRTKDDAFEIGHEIAEVVTSMNPHPVKLKFEKVYLPSVLLAKKRYVGFKYENRDDVEPVFDAKGIETVRRDGHPALQRMMEACIRILFRTRDLSLVKSYCQRQWKKIMEGNISVHDFIIAKEVRLGRYSDKVAPPPGAAVASRKMLIDHRNEPQYGERVPYIISQGEPKAKLNAQAVPPETMIENPEIQINSLYYITRTIVPPLSRVFNLLGADVESWFNELPKTINTNWHKFSMKARGKGEGSSSSSSKLESMRKTVLEEFFSDDEVGGAGGDEPIRNPKGSIALRKGKEPSTNSSSKSKVKVATTTTTLYSHLKTEHCVICQIRTSKLLCPDCRQDPTISLLEVKKRLNLCETRSRSIEEICKSCSGFETHRGKVVAEEVRGKATTLKNPLLPTISDEDDSDLVLEDEVDGQDEEGARCISTDCPINFTRAKEESNLKSLRSLDEILELGFDLRDRAATAQIQHPDQNQHGHHHSWSSQGLVALAWDLKRYS
ncbi:putative catalytic subunit of DNA polymerase zeta UPR-1 [Violaceomyces palustris]|uniref:Catalytic subunit of DNA polymerase zeta UPR-1 n=1 Tax=Violaceomyces palustris TaxID=1673888 RepID=A0ACD0P2F3_9BASI|nr:putative catalytic subunit of DNA polymerase zeta UPR-1 [Violaceomyces palustris]